MKTVFLAAALAALPAAGARADVVSEKPDSVAVTLYHGGMERTEDAIRDADNDEGHFAFVTETRTLELPAGPSRVLFRNVASTMVPESADVQGLPEGALERDFDYALLSPGSLLRLSEGKTAHLLRTDPKTGKESDEIVTIRATAQGAVLDKDGTIEALHCGGPHERLVFDRVPAGLTGTPVFSVRALVPTAGRYVVKLTYIAMRLDWSADYVARVRPDGRTLDLSGWMTIVNASDTSFADAPTDAVAGNLATTDADRTPYFDTQAVEPKCWPLAVNWANWTIPEWLRRQRGNGYGVYSSSPVTAVSSMEDARALGDYKLYSLPEPTTVAAHQTKQVRFLDLHGVKFERIYGYESRLDDLRDGDQFPLAVVEYALENKADSGLGKPLPAGTISMMEPDPRGAQVFAGQFSIDDTAVGASLFVDTGGALDVKVERRVLASQTIIHDRHKRLRDTVEIAIENHKPIPVAFQLLQEVDGDTRILSEDRAHAMERGGALWKMNLAPGERVVRRFQIEFTPR